MVRKLSSIAAFLLCLCFLSGVAEATIAVDGSNTAANSSTVTITTTQTNDVILLFAAGDGAGNGPTTSVTDTAGLTWHHAAGPVTVTPGGTPNVNGDLYYAVAASTLSSDTVTANGNGGAGRLMIMGISGANITNVLDCNASNPGTGTVANNAASISISNTTSSPDTMVVAWTRTWEGGTNFSACPTGYTSVISGGSFTGMCEKVLSSTQSATVTSTFSGNNYAVGIVSAINQSGNNTNCGSPFAAPPHHRGIFG